MKRIPGLLFRIYSCIPYLFFAVFLLALAASALASGGIILNDKFFDSILLKPLIIACVAGLFIFPLVALAVILYNRRKWPRLVYPLMSYGLYLVSVIAAGYMGWWTD